MNDSEPDGTSSPVVKAESDSPVQQAAPAGVEAIFLSPADAEEGSSGEQTSQELWRPAQGESGPVDKNAESKGEVQSAGKAADHSNQQGGEEEEEEEEEQTADDDKVLNKQSGQTPVESDEAGKPLPGKRTKKSTKKTKQKTKAKQQQQQQQQKQPSLEAASTTEEALNSTTTTADELPANAGRLPLRKSHSVTDVDGERESQVSSAASSARGRRMSISVAHYSIASSSRDSSRRSSAASIVISISRPDSPLPHVLLQQQEEMLEDNTVEFLRIRKTAATVHMAARFRHTNTLMPEAPKMTSEETAESLIRMHKERRCSMPTVPRLNLKGEAENGSAGHEADNKKEKEKANKRSKDGDQTRRRRRRRSSTGSSIQGFYMPASRPSSAMAGAAMDISRPSSSATIIQLGKLSRPWTPARSPSPVSMGSGNRWGSRNFFRSRTPTSMAAPLQALNQKVNNILGCASNILDFYQLRPDIKKEPDPLRAARLLKSKKMNQKPPEVKMQKKIQSLGKKVKESKPADKGKKPTVEIKKETKKEAVKKEVKPKKKTNPTLQFVKKHQIGKPQEDKSKKNEITKPKVPSKDEKPVPKLEAPEPPPSVRKWPPTLGTTTNPVSSSNLSVPGNQGSTGPGSTTSSTTSKVNKEKKGKKMKSKGIAILKSMMANRTPTVAAAAFVGKPIPLTAKVKINKVMKFTQMGRTAINKGKSMANNANRDNQGPPTLVNFFKRTNRSNPDSRVPIKYETFTDKDRAAAVLLGDADIKTTLEKQLKSGIYPT